MFLRIPQQFCGFMPLSVHVVQITAITRGFRQPHPCRRRHEEGVAPPPGNLRGIVRHLHDGVELRLDGSDLHWLRPVEVQVKVDLRHALIVGV